MYHPLENKDRVTSGRNDSHHLGSTLAVFFTRQVESCVCPGFSHMGCVPYSPPHPVLVPVEPRQVSLRPQHLL